MENQQDKGEELKMCQINADIQYYAFLFFFVL